MFSWSNVEVGQEIDGGRDSPPLLPSPERDLRLLCQSVFERESAAWLGPCAPSAPAAEPRLAAAIELDLFQWSNILLVGNQTPIHVARVTAPQDRLPKADSFAQNGLIKRLS